MSARLTADELEPGHRYGYQGGCRMGSVYAQGGGQFTQGPGARRQDARGAMVDGVRVDWVERNAAGLTFVHHVAACRGCGTA
jgi:hypothetical protein